MAKLTHLDAQDLRGMFGIVDEAREFLASGNPALEIVSDDEDEHNEHWQALSKLSPKLFLFRPDREAPRMVLFNLEVLAADPDEYAPVIKVIEPLVERNLRKSISDFA